MAFTFAWRGVAVGLDQVAQVQVEVPAAPGVRVDMDQRRSAPRVAGREAGLLDRLPQGPVRRVLAGLDVPARLHPGPEVPVHHQQHAAWSHDDRGPREVRGTGVLVERSRQLFQAVEQRRAAALLARVDGRTHGQHDRPDRRDARVAAAWHGYGGAHSEDPSADSSASGGPSAALSW